MNVTEKQTMIQLFNQCQFEVTDLMAPLPLTSSSTVQILLSVHQVPTQ